MTFLISACALGLALMVFFSATNRYIYRKPSGSATAIYCKAIWRTAFSDEDDEEEEEEEEEGVDESSSKSSIDQKRSHGNKIRLPSSSTPNTLSNDNNKDKKKERRGFSSWLTGGISCRKNGKLMGKLLVFGVFSNAFAVLIGIIQPFILQEQAQTFMSYFAFIVATLSILLICIPTVGKKRV
jgi:hypothetical protein